mgnify:CR=1 FL=1
MNQQSKKNLTNRIVALAGITVFAFFIGIYVCVFSNYLEQHNTRKKLFGATYMTMNNEFYKIVNNQIRMQVEKNGDQMITLDPALDQKKQNEQIKQLVKRKVDAIFLNPVDWEAVEPGLVAAKKAKIPVIVIDSQVYRSDLVAMTIVSDNYKAGVLCAKEMMKQKDQANIVLLTHNAARSAVDRINGFLDTIKNNKNYKILASADTQGQIERALPKVDKIIEEYQNIDIVMGLNDPAAMGALAALDSKGSCIRNRWFARREKADQRRYDDRNSGTISQTDGRHSGQCGIPDSARGESREEKGNLCSNDNKKECRAD